MNEQEKKTVMLEKKLNSIKKAERLEAAKELFIYTPEFKKTEQVNNHVHTIYSFSPYSPSAAAYQAKKAGLQIVGSIDHDSISGAREMLLASAMLKIASTVGFELRVSFKNTPLKNKKINNPDSEGLVYMCVHGVPENKISEVKEFLTPIHMEREKRNRAMIENLNLILSDYNFELSYDNEVLPLSMNAEGGSVTERHILYALSAKLRQGFKRSEDLLSFLEDDLKLEITKKQENLILAKDSDLYDYDLLGILKTTLLPKFFIQPNLDECIDVREVIAFSKKIGAIPAYAYLGDVTDSVTGDKKAEKFEDDFLEELFETLSSLGFPAVTYMPPRNTKQQLARVQKLCKKYGLMEISGVDINNPRQKFECPILLEPEYKHLVTSAWALVAHEKLAVKDPSLALFNDDNPFKDMPLDQRLSLYAKAAKEMDLSNPVNTINLKIE